VARDVATDQVVGIAVCAIHVSYKNTFNGWIVTVL
jgi:hypothetical protein